MATFQSFEEIDIWKKARTLTHAIYKISNSGELAKDFGLKDQMRRASVSIMSNIAEGFERNNNKEFILFLKYAKSSAGELRCQLYVVLDQAYIEDAEVYQLIAEVTEVSKCISGLIKYLKN